MTQQEKKKTTKAPRAAWKRGRTINRRRDRNRRKALKLAILSPLRKLTRKERKLAAARGVVVTAREAQRMNRNDPITGVREVIASRHSS